MSMSDWPSISYLYFWPESERLKKALNDKVDNFAYTTPSLKNEELLKDEIVEAVEQIQSVQFKRSEVGFDKNGLKTLIKEKRIKAAFNLTTQLLAHLGHGVNSQTNRKCIKFEALEIWNCRFQLLLAMKMQKLAHEEMESFEELDAPDLYFQYHIDYRKQNLSGSLVPFNLRLIHAEMPKYKAEMSKSYKRLANLEANIQLIFAQNLTSEQKFVWSKRLESVKLSKARLLYSLNDVENTVSLYKEISAQSTDKHLQIQIQKMLIKLATVYGNSELIEQFYKEGINIGMDNQFCRSLKLIFFGEYQEAIDCLSKNGDGADKNANWNNNAVSLLYMGRVNESVDYFINNPDVPVMPIILNLFTVSELASTKTPELRIQLFSRFCQQFSDLLEPKILKIVN